MVNMHEDSVPYTVLVASKANNVYYKHPLKVLFDSGSSSDFIYPQVLPKECIPIKLPSPLKVSLLDKETSVYQSVELKDIVLSEFSLT